VYASRCARGEISLLLGACVWKKACALNTHAASADQTAVFEYISAAEGPHPQSKSVFSYVFFLFRLIDALWHGASIARFSLWYNNPDMEVITKSISLSKVKTLAKNRFGNVVKAVVDVHKGIIAIDADLHSDEEAEFLSQGSKQENLWGINLYPELSGDDFIEFDSMINVRPQSGNITRGIDSPATRKKICLIVQRLIVI